MSNVHEFTVRTPDGRIATLAVSASTRAIAAVWIDRSGYVIVHRFNR